LADNLKNRTKILSLYLSTNPSRASLSEYLRHTRVKISNEEMMLLLQSSVFIKDSFEGNYPAKTALYILDRCYPRAEKLVHVYKNIMQSYTLFKEVLLRGNDEQHINMLYTLALVVGSAPLKVLIEVSPQTDNYYIDLLRVGVTRSSSKAPALKYLAKYLGMHMKYVARYIVDNVCPVKLCVDMGMDINVVGDKTYTTSSLKRLINAGYDFEPVEDNHTMMNILLRYTNKPAVHVWLKSYRDDAAVVNDYSRREANLFIQYMLLSCKFANIPECLTRYLRRIASDFKEVIPDTDKLTIKFADSIVSISARSYMGKYRAMDLFSGSGRVLTTKDQVRLRRKELKRTLPIR